MGMTSRDRELARTSRAPSVAPVVPGTVPRRAPGARATSLGVLVLVGAACTPPAMNVVGGDVGGDPVGGDDAGATTRETADEPPGATGAGDEEPVDNDENGTDSGGEPSGGDGSCDVWTQNCPRGTKCAWLVVDEGSSPWEWDTTCLPIDPNPKQLGEACEWAFDGVDDCDLGLMCRGMDVPYEGGHCTALCEGSLQMPTCGPPNTVCASIEEGPSLCISTCHPLLQDCNHLEACIPFGSFDWCSSWADCFPMPESGTFACVPEGGLNEPGAYCAFMNACSSGLFCLPTDLAECSEGERPGNALGCCAAYCDLADPICPEGNTQCVALYEAGEAPLGYETVGACMLI
jgi:hypothetical protein